jgi:vacuolar-type H+-ATPase subunit I/STV1
METKDETCGTARTVNELTKKIKKITRKTMAKVSELAMYQANAMSLYREKSEKEALLKQGLERLKRGEIPVEEIEHDYLKLQRRKEQKRAQLKALLEEKEIQNNSRLIQ